MHCVQDIYSWRQGTLLVWREALWSVCGFATSAGKMCAQGWGYGGVEEAERRRRRLSIGAPNVMWQWTTSLNSFPGSLSGSGQPDIKPSSLVLKCAQRARIYPEPHATGIMCLCTQTDSKPVHRKRRAVRLNWKRDFPNMCFLCCPGGVSAIMLMNAPHYCSIQAPHKKAAWPD